MADFSFSLVRHEIFFLAAALDFHVFVVQTTRLKQSNSKELERTRYFWTQNEEIQRNVELACPANLERVFSPLDLSGVCNFALCITDIVVVIVDGQFLLHML